MGSITGLADLLMGGANRMRSPALKAVSQEEAASTEAEEPERASLPPHVRPAGTGLPPVLHLGEGGTSGAARAATPLGLCVFSCSTAQPRGMPGPTAHENKRGAHEAAVTAGFDGSHRGGACPGPRVLGDWGSVWCAREHVCTHRRQCIHLCAQRRVAHMCEGTHTSMQRCVCTVCT